MAKKANGSSAATPASGALVPAPQLIVPELLTHEHRGDSQFKEDQAAVDVVLAELEKRIKLAQRECRANKKELVKQVETADKALEKALDAFANEYTADIVEAILETVKSVPLKSKKIETAIHARGLVSKGAALRIDVTVTGCKPHVKFQTSLEGKLPADTKKVLANLKKLQKQVKDIENRMLELHRSLANLDTAERLTRGRIAKTFLESSAAGKAKLAAALGDLDQTQLLLTE